MIVCSCNVLTDHDVRSALARIVGPRTAGQVYGSLGCRAQCGCCARTIRQIMDEALTDASPALPIEPGAGHLTSFYPAGPDRT
jgi:bacterioferritin-associated ferredoxin